ncbi:GMC family oxidoreductase [Aspergillus foveolatus]|uniref:GMC family oxidoreductase n=1 Tax=Aspergillus foveolatus TaxID=210207 RepID=UPI003CCD575B
MMIVLKSTLLSLAYLASPSLGLLNLGVPGISWSYDYVVVGGGTSGLALAARLAEDPGVTVAVVEAGGHYEIEGGMESIIPGFAAAANTGTDTSDDSLLIDWNFDTLPLTAANDRVLRYARGKCLGGTSARNLMVYHRGTQETYDQWADITGDSSWDWESVLPYFKKSCTLTPPDMTKRNKNSSVSYNADAFDNGLDGPLHVSWPNYGSPFSTFVEVGLEKIGILPGQDTNSGYLNGSAWAAATIDPSAETRSSSKTSFLPQFTLNFNVYAHTLAKKIIFSGTRARSVKVETLGISYTLTAKKEIIVSAGAFQSPQLLMVSGIGPKLTLQELGIKVVKDLPGVGQNLWDHALFGVVNRVNVVTASRLVNDALAAAEALAQYAFKKGPLTAPGFGVLGWEKLPNDIRKHLTNSTREALSAFPSDWPEVEYLSLDGILDGWHSADDQNLGDGYEYGTIAAALVAPLSRGSVSINSTDTADPPLIDLSYLTHPADREVAVVALKRARQAFNASGVTIPGVDEHRPGPDIQTDEEILDFIRSTIVPVWHAAGTCAMGNSSNPDAVVDSNGRVIGVQNLRVVDASIFPTLPPGHPQSTCYMVAEKIADNIKNGN